MQKSFILDINKCTGCHACQVACQIENQLDTGTSWRWVDTFNKPHYPGIPVLHLSLACNHCVNAPCMTHCPALAYSRDPATGAVIVDEAKCIGCRYCTWACPYDAPRFEPDRGVVTKCTFCNNLLAEAKNPACVNQCPTGALTLGDRNGPAADAPVPGFPQTDADPSIRFVPLRDDHPYPTMTAPTHAAGAPPRLASKVSLRSEWPLVVFTLIAALLVGMMSTPTERLPLNVVVFLSLATLGTGCSTLHLGRPTRAYRAVLNWRRSWLSREVILFGSFVMFSLIYLMAPSALAHVKWIAAGVGVAALFAMDSVYDVTRTDGLRLHSAQTLLTGLFVLAIATAVAPIFLGVAFLKMILYVTRKIRFARSGEPLRLWVSGARLSIGIVIPAAMWLLGEPEGGLLRDGWIVACIAAGEIVDRLEFYAELDVTTPQQQIAVDLSAHVAGLGGGRLPYVS
jgi:Fe-S-cluster-containing dehydrogenase component